MNVSRKVCGITLALGALGSGCAVDNEPATGQDKSSIQGGQVTTAYPAVGEVTHPTEDPNDDPGAIEFCTAELISPSWVLTARHCAGANMTFWTGNTRTDSHV